MSSPDQQNPDPLAEGSIIPPTGPLLPVPAAQSQPPQFGPMIGGTLMDEGMLKFLNKVDAPNALKVQLWGFMTAAAGFSNLTSNQAMGMIYKFKVCLSVFQISVPFRRQGTDFELQLSNLEAAYVYIIYRSVGDERERKLLTTQLQQIEQNNNQPSQRKGGILGFLH